MMDLKDWTDDLDWSSKGQVCRVCGQNKSLEDYALDGGNRHGRKRLCRACTALEDAEAYRNNREAMRMRNRAYEQANPRIRAARSRRRNERVKRAGRLSKTDKAMLISVYGACLACGTRELLEVDRVVAMINGGVSDWSNLQILCPTCNKKKGTGSTDYRDPKQGVLIGRILGMPLVTRTFATITLSYDDWNEPQLVA